MRNKNKKLLPLLAFAGSYAIWGLNTPLIKISVESVSIPLLLFVKFVIGTVFFSILARKHKRKISRKTLMTVALATFFGYVLCMALFYQGVKLTGGLNGSLIYLITPLVLFFFSIEFLKEKYDKRLLLSVFAGLTGSLLIIVGPLLGTNTVIQGSLLGNILVLGAVLADATGTILIKPALKKIPTAQITALRFGMASLMILPFAAHDMLNFSGIELSPSVITALVYNIVLATIVAFYLYHWGLKRISGEQASPLIYIDPMVGALGSVLILGDKLTPVAMVGVIILVSGIYFGDLRRKSMPHHTSHHR